MLCTYFRGSDPLPPSGVWRFLEMVFLLLRYAIFKRMGLASVMLLTLLLSGYSIKHKGS